MDQKSLIFHNFNAILPITFYLRNAGLFVYNPITRRDHKRGKQHRTAGITVKIDDIYFRDQFGRGCRVDRNGYKNLPAEQNPSVLFDHPTTQ